MTDSSARAVRVLHCFVLANFQARPAARAAHVPAAYRPRLPVRLSVRSPKSMSAFPKYETIILKPGGRLQGLLWYIAEAIPSPFI